jgi:hypothetical protein
MVEDKDGDTREEERWRDVFRGRAMRFDFADKFRGRVQVISKDFDGAGVKSSRGKWQTVETELAEFGRHFDVFAIDPLDAMAALTPQMIEGIFYLKKALDVPTALYFIDNTMVVFKATGREAFDVSGKHTLLEERGLLQRDIALVTGFLDVMYFRPQEGADSITEASVDRAERAASVAAAIGPSEAEKVARKAKRVAWTALGYLPIGVIVIFLASAVYGFIHLPSHIVAGWSSSGVSSAPLVPTLGYMIVMGFFIILPALMNNLLSVFMLLLHLLFMSANL